MSSLCFGGRRLRMELKGTNMIVKLVKADQKPEIVDDSEYCNIVSDKEGISNNTL